MQIPQNLCRIELWDWEQYLAFDKDLSKKFGICIEIGNKNDLPQMCS